MGLIFLEALAAGLILIFIIWWTMFSGRDKGELRREEAPETRPANNAKQVKEKPDNEPAGVEGAEDAGDAPGR